ncbi:hypothetical protein HYC85_029576 [Camellia sinensis]|uniref:Uncharacterized protein n=1 Tax=Camellia sinensis TaxID=4442 RepID=A0A7J7FYZ7_CAMSI|nr:hypothetical protein HYC85_029576 [Camellia sinensis]
MSAKDSPESNVVLIRTTKCTPEVVTRIVKGINASRNSDDSLQRPRERGSKGGELNTRSFNTSAKEEHIRSMTTARSPLP